MLMHNERSKFNQSRSVENRRPRMLRGAMAIAVCSRECHSAMRGKCTETRARRVEIRLAERDGSAADTCPGIARAADDAEKRRKISRGIFFRTVRRKKETARHDFPRKDDSARFATIREARVSSTRYLACR